MTDSEKEELQQKLKTLADEGVAAGLVARFYSDDVVVLCLPFDATEETPSPPQRQGTASPGRPRRKGGKGESQGTLL